MFQKKKQALLIIFLFFFLVAFSVNGGIKLDYAQTMSASVKESEGDAHALKDSDSTDGEIEAYVKVSAVEERVYAKKKESAGRTAARSTKNIVDTKHPLYSYKEMVADIKSLEKSYADYCSSAVIGESADGRKIYEVVLGNPGAEKCMVVVAALHAREYMTSQLCMKQIEYYLKNYNRKVGGVNIKALLDKVKICYVPMANPDGVAISQSGIKAIKHAGLRKRLRRMSGVDYTRSWKSNARGVDLNRNFPASFIPSYGGKRGSEGFTGTYSCSEAESAALKDYLEEVRREAGVVSVISYHTAGEIVFGSCPASAGKSMRKGIREMYRLARKITGYRSSAGYSYKGQKEGVGNLRTWLLEKCYVPCITIEIGTGMSPLPGWQFAGIWKENRELVIREAKLMVN